MTNKDRDRPSSPPGSFLPEDETASSLLQQFDEPVRHLDYESEMEPYVEGSLDAAGIEIVESHLENCAACRGDVEDLRRIAAPRRRRPWIPLAIAASLTILFAIALTFAVLRSRPHDVVVKTPTPVPQTGTTAPEHQEWASLVDRALSEGRLPSSPYLSELQHGNSAVRGEEFPQVHLAPNGVVVETAQPRFEWPATRGARYTVFVYEDEKEVANRPSLTENEWTPDRPLERGKTYAWQVEVARRGESKVIPQPDPALFRILSDAERRELDAARAHHDPLVLAVLYARAGLTREASVELAKLRASTDPRVQKLVRHHVGSP